MPHRRPSSWACTWGVGLAGRPAFTAETSSQLRQAVPTGCSVQCLQCSRTSIMGTISKMNNGVQQSCFHLAIPSGPHQSQQDLNSKGLSQTSRFQVLDCHVVNFGQLLCCDCTSHQQSILNESRMEEMLLHAIGLCCAFATHSPEVQTYLNLKHYIVATCAQPSTISENHSHR